MKTYVAIKAEIAKLEKQAEAARKAEVSDVIGRIKQAIAAYGLTADDLGLGRGGAARTRQLGESAPTSRRGTGSASASAA